LIEILTQCCVLPSAPKWLSDRYTGHKSSKKGPRSSLGTSPIVMLS